jgi:hypothetical protein
VSLFTSRHLSRRNKQRRENSNGPLAGKRIDTLGLGPRDLGLLHLGAAFAMQAGIGAIVALWPADIDGHAPVIAYQAAFAAIMAIQVAALTWFALSFVPAWKRRARPAWSAPDDLATSAREPT